MGEPAGEAAFCWTVPGLRTGACLKTCIAGSGGSAFALALGGAGLVCSRAISICLVSSWSAAILRLFSADFNSSSLSWGFSSRFAGTCGFRGGSALGSDHPQSKAILMIASCDGFHTLSTETKACAKFSFEGVRYTNSDPGYQVHYQVHGVLPVGIMVVQNGDIFKTPMETQNRDISSDPLLRPSIGAKLCGHFGERR